MSSSSCPESINLFNEITVNAMNNHYFLKKLAISSLIASLLFNSLTG